MRRSKIFLLLHVPKNVTCFDWRKAMQKKDNHQASNGDAD
jgi:hypothetical protein